MSDETIDDLRRERDALEAALDEQRARRKAAECERDAAHRRAEQAERERDEARAALAEARVEGARLMRERVIDRLRGMHVGESPFEALRALDPAEVVRAKGGV